MPMPIAVSTGPTSLAMFSDVGIEVCCPFAGMTRIRFKGFFSAQTGAPLGTTFNVCAGPDVSMRATALVELGRSLRPAKTGTQPRLSARASRQLHHRHLHGAIGLRDDAQRIRIEFDAGEAQGVHGGIDPHAVAHLLKFGERGGD